MLVHATNDQFFIIKGKDMKKNFIGIDFSKEKIDVAIISSDGLQESSDKVFNQFKSTVVGFRQFIKWVKENLKDTDPSTWLFCGENTGGYSMPLCNYLYGKGYDMWLENAKNIKDASGIRRLKSDRADAFMIAEYAMRFQDKAVKYEPLSEELDGLRELYRYRQKLVRDRASHMVRSGEKRLTQRKSDEKKLIEKSEARLIKGYDKEIDKVEKAIEALIASNDELKETYTIIQSVPGLGPQNAICMIVYTDNFQKFDFNPRKIACYYGIAPFGRDSGTSVHSDPHVHYMANRQIKAMLSQAALAAIRFNPVIANYYNRLIARGKKMQVALNNVKNKLIRIATALVRDHKYFNDKYIFTMQKS